MNQQRSYLKISSMTQENGKTETQKTKHKLPKVVKIILFVLLYLFIYVFLFFGFGLFWMRDTWSNLSLYELIAQLKTLNGVTGDTLQQFNLSVILPSLITFFLLISLIFVFRFVFKKDKKKLKAASCLTLAVTIFGSIAFSATAFAKAYDYLGVSEYISHSKKESDFIDDNYVSPDEAMMDFPEKKRNLIRITLESRERTYSDTSHGGFFEEDYLEGLSDLALENECFGNGEILNGAIALEYTDWTRAGLFAYSTGLPFKTGLGQNNRDTQESFFPNVVSLGDILNAQGYDQTFICGSDASFAGRKLYYQSHGNYTIHDYYTYYGQGYTSAENQWGFMDYHLFGFAKNEIKEKAKNYQENSKPFNYTMLTVDTHFYVGDSSHPDGFLCPYCKDDFDTQYANVIACSARQVTSFVNWFFGKDGNEDIPQDVRDNTTIVILGDHPTRSASFCKQADRSGYQRKTYVNFINSAKKRSSETERTFSHFDIFPTILSSLNVSLSSPYLALGVDLYSDEATYLETYGKDYINRQLQGKSQVINGLLKDNPYSYSYLKRRGRLPTAECGYQEKEDQITFTIDHLDKHGLDEELDQPMVYLTVSGRDYELEREKTSADSYQLTLNKADYFQEECLFEATFSLHGVTSGNTYSLGSVSKTETDS